MQVVEMHKIFMIIFVMFSWVLFLCVCVCYNTMVLFVIVTEFGMIFELGSLVELQYGKKLET